MGKLSAQSTNDTLRVVQESAVGIKSTSRHSLSYNVFFLISFFRSICTTWTPSWPPLAFLRLLGFGGLDWTGLGHRAHPSASSSLFHLFSGVHIVVSYSLLYAIYIFALTVPAYPLPLPACVFEARRPQSNIWPVARVELKDRLPSAEDAPPLPGPLPTANSLLAKEVLGMEGYIYSRRAFTMLSIIVF